MPAAIQFVGVYYPACKILFDLNGMELGQKTHSELKVFHQVLHSRAGLYKECKFDRRKQHATNPINSLRSQFAGC